MKNLGSMEAGTHEHSKSIPLTEKGAAIKEERIIKDNHLAALIKHSFNFFFLVTLAAYIVLMLGALKFFQPFYAVLAIVFMSPYFIMMLQMLPLLKGFYIERYTA